MMLRRSALALALVFAPFGCSPPAEPALVPLTPASAPPVPSAEPPLQTGAAGGNPAPAEEPVPQAPATDAGSAVAPVVVGPVKGGPRGQRPCEFRESVDTYPRTCTVQQNPDGTITVTAKGTSLNPNNGFAFRAGGGPERFPSTGTLDAFGLCKGAFAGEMRAIHNGSGVTYELRFRDHCMIVVR